MEKKSVLLFERDIKTSSLILPALLEKGFSSLHIRELEKIESLLLTKKFDILVCDADDERALKLLQDIKRNKEIKDVHIIMVTKVRTKKILVEFLECGACGIILRPFDSMCFIDRFLDVIKRIEEKYAAKRQHLRVEPYPWDKALAEFRHAKSLKLFSGPILNISMGGVLVDFKSQEFPFAVKDLLPNIRLSMAEYKLNCDAVVVAIKENLVALQITEMSEASKLALGKYVFKTINRLPDSES